MPIHSPPNPLAASHIRQEAYKTSWVNGDYPDFPESIKRINAPFITSKDFDPRGEAGLDPDGTWNYAKMYNWSSWGPAIVSETYMHQYGYNEGLRVAWKVAGNDLFRTGWAIYIGTDKALVQANDPTTLSVIARFAREYNPSEDFLKKYCDVDVIANNIPVIGGSGQDLTDLYVKALVTDQVMWQDVERFGDHYQIPPETAKVPDVTSPSKTLSVFVAFAHITLPGSGSGTKYYCSVIPIDGRQGHLLDNLQDPGFYTKNNSTVVSEYIQGRKFNVDNGAYGDAIVEGEKDAIKIFNGWGGITAQPEFNFVYITPEKLYPYFLQGTNERVWVAVSTNVTEILPNGGWWVQQGNVALVDRIDEFDDPNSLSSNTQYKIWMAPFKAGDDVAPSSEIFDIVVTTRAIIGNAPTNFNLQSVSGSYFTFTWHAPDNSAINPEPQVTGYFIRYKRTNETSWRIESTPNTTEYGFFVDGLIDMPPNEDWEFQVSAVYQDGNSSYSNTVFYTT